MIVVTRSIFPNPNVSRSGRLSDFKYPDIFSTVNTRASFPTICRQVDIFTQPLINRHLTYEVILIYLKIPTNQSPIARRTSSTHPRLDYSVIDGWLGDYPNQSIGCRLSVWESPFVFSFFHCGEVTTRQLNHY